MEQSFPEMWHRLPACCNPNSTKKIQMQYRQVTLEQLSQRTLNCLAASISGNQQANVLLSNRLAKPVAISYALHRIFARPDAGLYDLFLASDLLRYRRQFMTCHDAESESELIDQGHQSINSRFSRLASQTSGFCHCFHDLRQDPELVWSDATFTDIKELPETAPGPRTKPTTDQKLTLEIMNPSDMELVLQAIASGNFPLKRYKHLKVPVAELKLKLNDSEVGRRDQMLAEIDARKDLLDEFVRCYRINAMSTMRRRYDQRRFSTGFRLDTSRLASVATASRTGQPLKLFKKKNKGQSRVFLPESHIAFFGYDLNLMFLQHHFARPHPSMLGLLIKIFEVLGIRLHAYAFIDRLLMLPNRKKVILHVTIPLKHHDEPLDNVVWDRLATLYRFADDRHDLFESLLSGVEVKSYPIGLPGLHLNSLSADHDSLVENHGYRNRAMFLISDYQWHQKSCQTIAVQPSQVSWLTQQLEDLQYRFPDTNFLEYIFVASYLKLLAPVGSRVNKMHTFTQ